jgi:CMP-N,N'-diacetyllegionaminic acid synthase
VRNLAVIPARSGSKGLKDKNIRLLQGKPLIAYTIEAARQSGLFDEIFVSTDSEEYARIAVEWGAQVPFLRNQNLASDTASSWEVVREAVQNYKARGREFDTVALLQPTSPLRVADDIRNGYEQLQIRNANAVVGVCEVDHSPLWCNTLPEDNSLDHFLNPNVVNRPRQSLPTFFRINGALYLVQVDYLMQTGNLYEKNAYALIMSKENSLDIDDETDFRIAEVLMGLRKSDLCPTEPS